MITQARLDEIRELRDRVFHFDISPSGHCTMLAATAVEVQNAFSELIEAIEDAYTPRHQDVLLCITSHTRDSTYVAQYCDLGYGMTPYWKVAGVDDMFTDDEILPYAVELLYREEPTP